MSGNCIDLESHGVLTLRVLDLYLVPCRTTEIWGKSGETCDNCPCSIRSPGPSQRHLLTFAIWNLFALSRRLPTDLLAPYRHTLLILGCLYLHLILQFWTQYSDSKLSAWVGKGHNGLFRGNKAARASYKGSIVMDLWWYTLWPG